MLNPKCLPVVAAAIAVAVLHGAAQAPPAAHFPTNEDLRHTRSLNDPRLSPDGRFVLVNVTDPTVDGASNHLWLVDIEKNTSRQLTFAPPKSKSSENQGRWSADGQFVFFTAHRGAHTQLFRLPMNGGEAAPVEVKVVPTVDGSTAADAVAGAPASGTLSPTEVDVSSYAPSPNGRLLAIVARDPETPGEKKQQDDRADAEFVDHDLHGSRVYLYDLQTSTVTPIAVPPDVSEVEWSHQSDRLVVIADPQNHADDVSPDSKGWMVDVRAPAAPRQLSSLPPTLGGALWSANDARIFFEAQAGVDAPPGYVDLYALALDGGRISNLSTGFLGSVDGATVSDGDSGAIAAVALGTQGGYARFDASTTGETPIAIDHGFVSQLATNDRRTGWVYTRADTDRPSALYFAKTLGAPGTRLATPATAGEWRAVKASVVHWQNDGLPIEGLLYLPPEAASRKVPLIVNVHGGPTGAWLESYTPFTQFLLGHGWAVLMPNPRGSTGCGAAFAAANKNDLGGGDYRDIMAGVDVAIANDPIDPAKLGLYGYSYGGEMAGFVEGKTDRFKAIVSGAPVIDQFSEYGTEDGSWYDRWFFGKPWEHVEDAWRQSPLAGASHGKTPFLLLQGEADTVDPVGQSQEMYRALRQAGVPVELVTYPRENHGPLSRGIGGGPASEPWHGFDARQRIVKFFETAFAR